MLSRIARRAITRPSLQRNVHISSYTVEHPTPESLSSLLKDRDASSHLFYTLSTSIPEASLSPLLEILQSDPSPSNSVGSFHLSRIPTVSVAVLTPEQGESISTFYTPASGRGHAEVGKWQRIGTSWTEDTRGNMPGELESVISGKGWEGVWAAAGDDAVLDLAGNEGTVLVLTDANPSPVLKALKDVWVAAGLVTAPTPFLTGRPHTLFHGTKVYEKGSVGLAISSGAGVRMEYGVEPMDVPMTVAAARGNLLLRLDGATIPNPTQTLIAALQRRDRENGKEGKRDALTKDEDFYLGILTPGPQPRMVRIASGDPSRGALSLEMEGALMTGQVVQFMHRPDLKTPKPLADTIRFSVLPRTDDVHQPAEPGETKVIPGFLATSEGGFVGGDPIEVCTVAGAVSTVMF